VGKDNTGKATQGERSINKKYKAIIFDLFGTLIDNFSRPEYESVLAEVASILAAPPDEFTRLWLDTFPLRNTGVIPTPRANMEYLCQKLGLQATENQIEQAIRVRLDLTVRTMKPRPSSVEVLTQLKSEGYKTGLISDCSGETPMVWGNTPLAPLFDVTVFSCQAGMKKPDPRIYLMATDQLGVEPKNCLYIGDGSSQELTGAAQVGMHPVLIRVPDESVDDHFVDREENWNGPTISSLQEVLNLLKP
jgi:putative hydrolase of the HAD superfamily